MNRKLTTVAVILASITSMSRLHAQGELVANGVTYGGFNGIGYEIDVVHNPATAPAGGSTTGFALDPNGKTPSTAPFVNTFRFDPLLDVGVRVFFVSPNDPITAQAILSMDYTELKTPNSYIFLNSPIYVALYTGNQSFAPTNGIYSDPLFGWAELQNVNGAIQLLGGALEYQGGGIYAGTDTIIPTPEPGTWALMLCGAGLLGMTRNRRK